MAIVEKSDLDAVWADGPAMEAALRRAGYQALLRHKLLGESIVGWDDDGKVKIIPPEEIEIPEEYLPKRS
jgi:hypothetical protein